MGWFSSFFRFLGIKKKFPKTPKSFLVEERSTPFYVSVSEDTGKGLTTSDTVNVANSLTRLWESQLYRSTTKATPADGLSADSLLSKSFQDGTGNIMPVTARKSTITNTLDGQFIMACNSYRNPWISSACMRSSRACTSGGWKLVADIEYEKATGKKAKRTVRNRIMSFLNAPGGDKNPKETLLSLLYRTVIHLSARTEAAWYIGDPDASGFPKYVQFLRGYLLPLTSNGDVYTDAPNSFVAKYEYRYPLSGGPTGQSNLFTSMPLSLNQVIRFCIEHPFDGVVGEIFVESLSNTIASYSYAVNWNMSFFEKSAIPQGVWVVAAGSSPEQVDLFKSELKSMMVGPTKAQSTPVVVSGEVKFEKAWTSPHDAEFGMSNIRNREEMLAVMGVPPTKLGIIENVNNAVSEDQDKGYIEWDLRFFHRVMEETLNRCFVQWGCPGWNIKFKPASWLVTQAEAEVATRLVGQGIWSINEARDETTGGDPIPGGDEHICYTTPPGPIPIRIIATYTYGGHSGGNTPSEESSPKPEESKTKTKKILDLITKEDIKQQAKILEDLKKETELYQDALYGEVDDVTK